MTLRASPSGQPIDDNEVRRKFQAFGDIKSVRLVNDRVECVIVYRSPSLTLRVLLALDM